MVDVVHPLQHARKAVDIAAVHDAILLQFASQQTTDIARTALTTKLSDRQTELFQSRTKPIKKADAAAFTMLS